MKQETRKGYVARIRSGIQRPTLSTSSCLQNTDLQVDHHSPLTVFLNINIFLLEILKFSIIHYYYTFPHLKSSFLLMWLFVAKHYENQNVYICVLAGVCMEEGECMGRCRILSKFTIYSNRGKDIGIKFLFLPPKRNCWIAISL